MQRFAILGMQRDARQEANAHAPVAGRQQHCDHPRLLDPRRRAAGGRERRRAGGFLQPIRGGGCFGCCFTCPSQAFEGASMRRRPGTQQALAGCIKWGQALACLLCEHASPARQCYVCNHPMRAHP